MAVRFKDDSPRLMEEFASPKLNGHLRSALNELAAWLEVTYELHLYITCLMRTEEENRAVGGVPLSSHVTWRAADIRTWAFTPEIEQDLLKHLQNTWPAGKLCVVIHNSGSGKHLHINVNYGWLKANPGA